jgi:hypothetical protein
MIDESALSSAPDSRTRVLYIAGFGRSGSTVLDRLLAQDQRFHSGGEIDAMWALGVLHNRLCSCGVSFGDCPFWGRVSRADPGLLTRENALLLAGYLAQSLPARYQWRMLSKRTRTALATPEIGDLIQRLYRAVREASERQIIVDSSKHPTYLYLLGLQPTCEVRVIHLVRDPRAVSFSWGRPTVADPDGETTMSTFGDAKASALWLMFNHVTELVVQALDVPRMLVRYEDLMRDQDVILERMRRFAWGDEMEGSELAQIPSTTAELAPPHMVSGNPMRFQSGPIKVREDQAWRTDMRPWRKRVVTLLTLPRLGRYRYPVIHP